MNEKIPEILRQIETVVVGKNGCEEIIDDKLNAEEKDLFEKSAAAVRKMNQVLADMKVI